MADPKLKPVKCKRTLGEYAERVTWCEACGRTVGKLDLHHIIKRGRSDERCNLLRLCITRHCVNCGGRGVMAYGAFSARCKWCNANPVVLGCHDRAEAQGRQELWFPLGLVLAIKKLRDPDGWDPERLRQLFLKNLPDLQPVPPDLLAEFERWQPYHPKEPT